MLRTRNFDELEFYRPEKPPAEIIRERLPRMMHLAQWLRDLAGSPGLVSSYWRSPGANELAGGVPDSAHLKGDAEDLEFPLISLRELARRVLAAEENGSAPEYGELIFYNDKGHVHITAPGVGGRGELLVSPGKDARGVRIYRPLTDLRQVATWSNKQKKSQARSRSRSAVSRSRST